MAGLDRGAFGGVQMGRRARRSCEHVGIGLVGNANVMSQGGGYRRRLSRAAGERYKWL